MSFGCGRGTGEERQEFPQGTWAHGLAMGRKKEGSCQTLSTLPASIASEQGRVNESLVMGRLGPGVRHSDEPTRHVRSITGTRNSDESRWFVNRSLFTAFCVLSLHLLIDITRYQEAAMARNESVGVDGEDGV